MTVERSTCVDRKCPFHGNLSIRGKILTGKVVSDRMQRTVVVQVDYLRYYSKYKRYARSRSKIHAHNPSCINAVKGDIVKIAECRPLSKTVSFVVIEKDVR
ncbi:MAG: 30S ribosomal protein S17 [Candidatus Methanomethyliaceae archaeon]|nr:30S ribosomal protein S17 [Candidatus Methanomethyliaceae archaeon]MDW7970346.1 30S ribosomal protein S17 [Nitrososphaerota archaeon]